MAKKVSKVTFEVHCQQKKHGVKSSKKNEVGAYVVKVPAPMSRKIKQSGCPHCAIEARAKEVEVNEQ